MDVININSELTHNVTELTKEVTYKVHVGRPTIYSFSYEDPKVVYCDSPMAPGEFFTVLEGSFRTFTNGYGGGEVEGYLIEINGQPFVLVDGDYTLKEVIS